MGHNGPVVAVLGGGQLGRMLALSGIPLGLEFRFLDPSSDACAGADARSCSQRHESPKSSNTPPVQARAVLSIFT